MVSCLLTTPPWFPGAKLLTGTMSPADVCSFATHLRLPVAPHPQAKGLLSGLHAPKTQSTLPLFPSVPVTSCWRSSALPRQARIAGWLHIYLPSCTNSGLRAWGHSGMLSADTQSGDRPLPYMQEAGSQCGEPGTWPGEDPFAAQRHWTLGSPTQ